MNHNKPIAATRAEADYHPTQGEPLEAEYVIRATNIDVPPLVVIAPPEHRKHPSFARMAKRQRKRK